MRISIVVPVFRNEATLHSLYIQLEDMFSTAAPAVGREYVFVDDGSDDQSLRVLTELHEQYENVHVLRLSRNFGQVPAIIAGLNEASGDAILILSADLQDPIEIIPKMIEAWKGGNQIVIAHRQNRQDNFQTRLTSGIFYQLMKLSRLELPSGGFDFVLLDRKANEALKQIKGRNRFLQGDMLWIGFQTQLIPYERKARPFGKSQWSFMKKVKYLLDGVISSSYWPIRLMSLMGLLTAFSGFFYILIIVYMRFVHQVPFIGWAPIMVVILWVGGIIMLMLGIIGEYLWRIYDEVRERPYYIIQEKKKHP